MERKPGELFEYSNVGAGLLGQLICRQVNKTFEEIVIKNICTPLKMRHTKIILNKKDSGFLAQGYNGNGEPTPLWNMGSLQGSGALKSTLADMIRYIQLQIKPSAGRLGTAIQLTQQLSFSTGNDKMGLGWRIKELHNSQYYYHAGGTGGFRSFAAFNKKQEFGVVILSNAADEVTPIGEQIMEVIK